MNGIWRDIETNHANKTYVEEWDIRYYIDVKIFFFWIQSRRVCFLIYIAEEAYLTQVWRDKQGNGYVDNVIKNACLKCGGLMAVKIPIILDAYQTTV